MEEQRNEKPIIYILVGPTAVGKTALSIQLAKAMDAEIVSADSIQVYQELDIGSAKPTVEEMQGVPHHMLGVVPVSEAQYSVAQYQKDATRCIADILARGKRPFVVGGTGLYVHGLTHPMGFTQVPANPAVRAQLAQEEAAAPGTLYQQLQQVDPISAQRLHPNDTKRIVRAMEVYRVSGQPMSTYGADFTNAQGADTPYTPVMAGLTMERSRLYTRINRRVDMMLQDGLLEEARQLYEAGHDRTLPALQGLGYKQLLNHLYGEISLDTAIEDIKRETRRFAKRQWTWFKRDQRIRWFDALETSPQALFEGIQSYYLSPDDGEGKKE